jgi:6,7-dimethyl-8-ribityllumazine synthase
MSKILIISSNIHAELSSKQLANCLELVKKSDYEYQVEILKAGTYEIPFVIQAYHQKNIFDGYIALGLVLKTNADHFDYIMSHIKTCFSQFALDSIPVGNGIITGSNIEELSTKIHSDDPCLSAYPSAFNAVDYLIKLNKTINNL